MNLISKALLPLILTLSFNISASEKERIYNRQSAFVSEEMQTLRFNDTAAFPGGVVPMSGYGPNCNLEDFINNKLNF